MAGAVPVLPAKAQNNDLEGAWGIKSDPWNNKPQPQQVPDPWNAKSLEKAEPLDPWAPVMKNQSNAVSSNTQILVGVELTIVFSF